MTPLEYLFAVTGALVVLILGFTIRAIIRLYPIPAPYPIPGPGSDGDDKEQQ